jgi:hypothetical protein
MRATFKDDDQKNYLFDFYYFSTVFHGFVLHAMLIIASCEQKLVESCQKSSSRKPTEDDWFSYDLSVLSHQARERLEFFKYF